MKLKTVELNGATYAEVADGKPVYLGDDNKELPFDVVHTVGTINRLNGEAKSHREAKEAAEAKLKGFEGIEDPDAARKAMETVKNYKDGDLVQAGKVDEMKRAWENSSKEEREAAVRQSNADRDKWKKQAEKLESSLFQEMVGGSFSRSKFVGEKVAIPSEFLQARFGDRFKVENGKVIGYGTDGQPIYSRTRAGEVADFDEAIEFMVDSHPQRDLILKGTQSSGGGARPSNGGGGGARQMRKAEFDGLLPAQQASLMSSKDRPVLVD